MNKPRTTAHLIINDPGDKLRSRVEAIRCHERAGEFKPALTAVLRAALEAGLKTLEHNFGIDANDQAQS